MRKLMLIILLLLAGMQLWAQNRTLSGRVVDATGNPVSRASIQVKNSTQGVSSGEDGQFSITVSPSARILVVSAVGMTTSEIAITSENSISISLAAASGQLEEVVVTGVGVATSKKKVAISVESIAGKDLPRVPQGSIDQALVGKIAGAQIMSTSGQPGQQAAILLRGINTLGSTQPMILVDGVQINAGNNFNGSASNLSSRLSDLDLSNVERIEVVQGAAAATIYGAQGANGVIQIFTRKGSRNGRTNVSVSSRTSFDKVLRGPLSTAQNHYYETDAEGFIVANNGIRLAPDPVTGIYAEPKKPASLVDAQNNKPFAEPTFDHIGYLFRPAQTWNHNVNLNGGRDRMDYALNLSRLRQESVFTGDYTRTNISLNLGIELFKNFNIRSTTQLVYSENSTGGITGQDNIYSPLATGLTTRQYLDLRTLDSRGNAIVNPIAGETAVNPFYTRQFQTFQSDNTRIIQNVNLNFRPFQFLEIDYKLGIDNYRFDNTNFIAYQLNTLTPGQGLDPQNGQVTYDRDNQTFRNSLLSLFLRTDFQRDLKINVPVQSTTQVTYDYRRDHYNNLITQGTGFAPFPPYNINGTTASNSEGSSEFVTFGYLVNQKFDWGNLFGFSGGVRVDYSSAFGSGSDAFVFPRADAYFRLSEVLKSSVLTEWKLRGAYGKAGIQPGAYDRFVTLNSGNIGTNGYLSTKAISNNPLLNVEVSSEKEIGTDIGLKLGSGSSLQNIRISATYWDKSSEDVIRSVSVPSSTGLGGILTNAISLASNGIQASLDADLLRISNFTWDFGVRFGKSKSIVTKTAGGKEIVLGTSGSGQFALKEGASVGAFYGVAPLSSLTQATTKGVRYISDADLGNFEIVNGMVVSKTSRQVQFTTEQQAIGDPNPDFNMTILNNFTLFKNLTISTQLDWVQGNQIYNKTRQWMYRDFLHSDFDLPVTINGQTGAWVNYHTSLYKTNQPNPYFVEDGSFVRLRDVSISYQFGSLIGKKLRFIREAELSLSGRNLLTLTNYTGLDPEASASLNNPLRRGLDLYTFPNFRTFQVGLNLGF